MLKKFFALLMLPVLLAGCATSRITNLTPSRLPRNETGLYPIEMAWDSSQQTIRDQTITPFVVTGFNSYEMRHTLGIENRWEAFVPVGPGTNYVLYHFKVDYQYRRMGNPGTGSVTSKEYKLTIVDENAGPQP